MNQPAALAQLRHPKNEGQLAEVSAGFGTLQSFELMMRQAKMLSNSTLVPTAYRSMKEVKEYGKVVGYEENPNAISNCVIALNMATRMQADPLMVMQNLNMIEGRPSWSSQYIIAAINSCGRYSPLRFQLSEPGELVDVEYTATDWVGGKKVATLKKVKVRHQTCFAWAIEKGSNERLQSPVVSIEIAVAEGWLTKNGSKWQTMPDMMLRYRSAAFFGRFYAPELLMGLRSSEEEMDGLIIDHESEPTPVAPAPIDVNSLKKPTSPAPQPTESPMRDAEPAAPAESKAPEPATTSQRSFIPTPEELAEIQRQEQEQAEAEERARFGDPEPAQQPAPAQAARRGRGGNNSSFNLE
jgi:hypothetical protein